MIIGSTITSLEELYDDFIKNYELGYFTEGISEWNGDDALMSPKSFAHTFKKRASELGFKFELVKLEYSTFIVLYAISSALLIQISSI